MSEHDTHEQGSEQGQGLGPDGTIPDDPDGLGATTTDEQSTFEPEEDEAAPGGAAERSGEGSSAAAAAEGGDADPMQDAGLGV